MIYIIRLFRKRGEGRGGGRKRGKRPDERERKIDKERKEYIKKGEG